ncbi:MAG TPA: hypothetical protein VGR78_12455, partial [Verrucomicrobiae bacterium]|nr:hypothetical protein [Verrucomicrobiae bacterium]
AALFRLAQANVSKYPAPHENLDIADVLRLIQSWLNELESAQFTRNPLQCRDAPRLALLEFEPAPLKSAPAVPV